MSFFGLFCFVWDSGRGLGGFYLLSPCAMKTSIGEVVTRECGFLTVAVDRCFWEKKRYVKAAVFLVNHIILILTRRFAVFAFFCFAAAIRALCNLC